jgi:predicted MPP superfamily phosphohydrolase
MPAFAQFALAPITLAGHFALWTWLFNRLHATAVPKKLVRKLEKITMAVTFLLAVALVVKIIAGPGNWLINTGGSLEAIVIAYSVVCWLMLVYAFVPWVGRTLWPNKSAALLSNHTEQLNTVEEFGERLTGDRMTDWLARIPGNQILQIHAQRKTLHLPRLPLELNGLKIAHLSDLHMTGQLRREFFERAIEKTNQWGADVVAVTGDIVDKAFCIEWIPQLLGQLTCKHGRFFVLGNHDKRVPLDRLRETMQASGYTDLGGRTHVVEVNGCPLLLAGNELPWIGPAPQGVAQRKTELPANHFSVLLAHTPDQIVWSRQQGFDLMLAGHTHGGQIRLPLIGPVISPSRYGVKYAGGLFDEPPTLMHVSRGLSALHPLRFRCPPEITLLELRKKP